MANSYFQEYENLEIHELMLRDKSRNEAYQKAILSNKSLFHNKIVLDVGSGTGILSLLCAKAGAKIVLAVEATNLAKLSRDIIDENNLSSIIKVFQAKIEEFELPTNIDKVDIIISEWMGFYLLHEGMLDSVIYARDKFLKEEGILFPEYAIIYVAPCSVPSRFESWDNVNGLSMKKFAEYLRIQKSGEPEIMLVKEADLLHDGVIISWLDLNDITVDDINEINITEVIPTKKSGIYQGLCIWFECRFPTNDLVDDAVVLSTNPKLEETHWKQCVVVLPKNSCEIVDTGEPIAFNMILKRNEKDPRKYHIELNLLNSEEVEHPISCECIMTKCILSKTHLATLNNAAIVSSGNTC